MGIRNYRTTKPRHYIPNEQYLNQIKVPKSDYLSAMAVIFTIINKSPAELLGINVDRMMLASFELVNSI